MYHFVGVVGPAVDSAILKAAVVLGAADIPIVSPTTVVATAGRRRMQTPANVLRTLPSSSYQAQVGKLTLIADIYSKYIVPIGSKTRVWSAARKQKRADDWSTACVTSICACCNI